MSKAKGCCGGIKALRKLASRKAFLALALIMVFGIPLSACGAIGGGGVNADLLTTYTYEDVSADLLVAYTEEDVNADLLIGRWELHTTTFPGASTIIHFRNDGTGFGQPPDRSGWRYEFTWSLDGRELTIIDNETRVMQVYTISELNDSTLSYEIYIPQVGLVRMTYALLFGGNINTDLLIGNWDQATTDFSGSSGLFGLGHVDSIGFRDNGTGFIRFESTRFFDFTWSLDGHQFATSFQMTPASLDPIALSNRFTILEISDSTLTIERSGARMFYTYTRSLDRP